MGTGPGDPGLLTVRAREALAGAPLVVTDPDVPEAVLAAASPTAPRSAPPSGEPADVAKDLVAEAAAGRRVTRLVARRPADRRRRRRRGASPSPPPACRSTSCPGVPAGTAVPAYAGVPLGSAHVEADVRAGVDWAAAGRRARAARAARHRRRTWPRWPPALTEHGVAAQTPVAVTANGTVTTPAHGRRPRWPRWPPRPPSSTARWCVTVGAEVGLRAELSWWESRALYGWRVLVPRTKDQAGAMSERLRRARRHRRGGADDRRRAAAHARADGARGQGPGRRPLPVGGVHLDQRGARGVGEVRRVRAGRPRVLRREDRLRRRGHRGEGARASASSRSWCRPDEPESSSEGLLAIFPPHDDVLDPVDRVLLPRADIATETLAAGLRDRGWEIDDVTAYRTVRAAPPPAPIREAIKTGGFDAVCFTSSSTVRNLVGIAGKPHARTIVACIGPKTAETAREFGLRVDVQPEEARVPGAGRRAGRARRPAARRGRAAAAAEGQGPPPLTRH